MELKLRFEEQLGSQDTVIESSFQVEEIGWTVVNRCYPWEMTIWVIERVRALKLDQLHVSPG